ncbi:MAG TPA: aldo/keto reductase [Gammaproteobacteria bacterium]
MQKRPLGNTDIEIAPLVFGGNVFGWTVDERGSFELLDNFFGQGFNAIDTADSYSMWVEGNRGGESETIIGNWLARTGKRSEAVIITKVGTTLAPDKKGLSAKRIVQAAEDSLRRLRTDYIDVYLSHRPDPETPIDDTLRGYQRLIEDGKVRVIGCSNYDAAQLREALETAATDGLPRYQVLQPEYNLYDRAGFEGELRDLCLAEGLGVIPYFALASGFLTGKYRSPEDASKSPRGERVVGKYLDDRGRRILHALDEVAKRHDAKPAEVALAWLISREGVTAPIASATSLEQLESLVLATQLRLTAEDVAALTQAGD